MADETFQPLETNAVQLEVFIQRFRSVAEEMGYALQRTGYTAFVNETADLGVALVTPQGEIFGYPHSIGITMFASLDFSTVIETSGAFEEGDIIICNDPYSTGGLSSHLPDISVLMPIFDQGTLVCFSYAYVHSTDIGGKVAGSLSPSSYEIFQEGIRIPPMKLYRRGELNQDILRLILSNCRVAKDNRGDIRAMVTALRVGERRVLECILKHGREAFTRAMYDVLSYSEQRARRVISGLTDGSYAFSDYLDDDVVSATPIKFCVTLHVSGSSIEVDFSRSDVQVRSAFNLFSRGRAHPWLVYKVMFLLLTLQPDIPVNAGLMRPISASAPEGSIVNCEYPAAVGLRTTTGVRAQDAICGALARVLPDVMPAAGAGYIAPVVFAEPNLTEGGVNVNVLEPMVGGTGASSAGDGLNARDVVDIANLRNSPLEIVESTASVRILSYALRPDSGGAGKFRGGLGAILEFVVMTEDCLITARGQERHRFRPWGLRGGDCGTKGAVYLKRAGEREFVEIGKIDSLRASMGDVLQILTPGGGGYGPAFARDAERVLDDVLDGFVSEQAAERDFGVVIRLGRIDLAATGLRRGARLEPTDLLYTFGPERDAYEEAWTEDVWSAYVAHLYALPTALRAEARSKLWRALDALASRQGGRLAREDVETCWQAVAPSQRVTGGKARLSIEQKKAMQ